MSHHRIFAEAIVCIFLLLHFHSKAIRHATGERNLSFFHLINIGWGIYMEHGLTAVDICLPALLLSYLLLCSTILLLVVEKCFNFAYLRMRPNVFVRFKNYCISVSPLFVFLHGDYAIYAIAIA